MKQSCFFCAASALAVSALALSSCAEGNEPEVSGGNDGAGDGKFVIAASIQGSNATSYVLLTAESLDGGKVSAVNNGLVNDGASQWVSKLLRLQK